MDRHAEVVTVGRGAARRGIGLAALLLAVTSGCVTTDQLVPDLVGSPTVTQVAVFWNPHLMAGVDPVHHGAAMYGLAARAFLFSPGLTENLPADGNLVVEMYGALPEQPQAPPALLETWEIKKDILNSVCHRKDGFGWGYTLNLPWEHYRPDVTQLEIRTRYEPSKGGTPIYSVDRVTLAGTGPGPEIAASKRLETGDRRVITSSAPPAPPQAGVAVPAQFPPPQGVAAQPGFAAPPQQPGAVPPAVYQAPQTSWTLPARPPVPAPQAGALPPAFPVPPQQPPMVQPIPPPAPPPAGAVPPAFTVSQPQGAVQPAVYQVPGQSPYQPQPVAAFPGAGPR